MTPILVLGIIYLLSGVSATASQGHYLKDTLVDTGQWAEQGVVYQSGNIYAIN